jgi:hypothetical protein
VSISDDVKKRMRNLLREAIEDITSEEEFWAIFDAHVEAELAKTSCLICFDGGEVYIYVGEGSDAPGTQFKIAEVGFSTTYDNFIPVSAEQVEEAEQQLRAIDNFSARVQELRAQVAANIEKCQTPKT